MKLAALILTVALQAATLTPHPERSQVKTPVYLVNEDVYLTDLQIEFMAKKLTKKMFADIGVGIEWQPGRPAVGFRLDYSILITVTKSDPKIGSPHTFGAAEPFGKNQITIFFRRIERHSPESTAFLLSYVLAHEITHVLEGLDYHAPTGIMRSYWDADDFARIYQCQLRFTPYDIRLIQLGLVSRTSKEATGGRD